MKSAFIRDLSIIIAVCFFGFVFLPLLPTIEGNLSFVMGAILSGSLLSLAHRYFNPATDNTPSVDNDVATTTLYIGNLAYKVSESAIKDHFAELGYVKSVRLMSDKRTGKKKGFGFLEVESDIANKMIETFNDTIFHERTLKVRLAKEKKHPE